jgi:hypothetical protein
MGTPPLDLRALVDTAMTQRWPVAAKAHLARLMAPRWGISPDSAEHRIGRWLNRVRDITSDDLALLLDALGLVIVPR